MRFCELLCGIVATAGYSKSVTVYIIRKYLRSVIEGTAIKAYRLLKEICLLISSKGKHGSALVSQIYRYKDTGIYLKEYVLYCSSIDTVSAVLGEEEHSYYIEYF